MKNLFRPSYNFKEEHYTLHTTEETSTRLSNATAFDATKTQPHLTYGLELEESLDPRGSEVFKLLVVVERQDGVDQTLRLQLGDWKTERRWNLWTEKETD